MGLMDMINQKPKKGALNRKGYTLIELLVALAISSVVLGAIISTYQSQQKSYVVEDQVAAMQQNIRVGLFYMERDFRMAGCDPRNASGAGIETADTGTIHLPWISPGEKTMEKTTTRTERLMMRMSPDTRTAIPTMPMKP